MNEPIMSISSLLEEMAILALDPGSLATALTSMVPSYNSGTSCSNSFTRNCGLVLDKKI